MAFIAQQIGVARHASSASTRCSAVQPTASPRSLVPRAAHADRQSPASAAGMTSQLGGKLAAAALAALVAFGSPSMGAAQAAEAGAPAAAAAADGASKAPTTTLYFGNGCFWGRQKDFVDAEVSMGRSGAQVSAVVGYAGGKAQSDKVCYYYAPPSTVYEKLGHAEVVQVEVSGAASEAQAEVRRLADVYFSQFKKTKFGMMRQDPQDAGPGYRNVVGLPGGIDSPLFPSFAAANRDGMELRRGEGGGFDERGKPLEDDALNVVWVVDSEALPFYRAEKYHQYHDGLGKPFPKSYKVQMKKQAEEAGRVAPTGCPEIFFF